MSFWRKLFGKRRLKQERINYPLSTLIKDLDRFADAVNQRSEQPTRFDGDAAIGQRIIWGIADTFSGQSLAANKLREREHRLSQFIGRLSHELVQDPSKPLGVDLATTNSPHGHATVVEALHSLMIEQGIVFPDYEDLEDACKQIADKNRLSTPQPESKGVAPVAPTESKPTAQDGAPATGGVSGWSIALTEDVLRMAVANLVEPSRMRYGCALRLSPPKGATPPDCVVIEGTATCHECGASIPFQIEALRGIACGGGSYKCPSCSLSISESLDWNEKYGGILLAFFPSTERRGASKRIEVSVANISKG